MEHVSSCQVSIDNGSTDNIHVLIVQYGLRVEIKESQKKKRRRFPHTFTRVTLIPKIK